nr:retrovirus-related Pol polyprotein from transposon TNT 1-94 [Tanacetum cinerariifolium]
MLLSAQHAGFGEQQEMILIMSPKTVDHTCLKDLTMLIFKADSSLHMTGNKSFFTDYQEIDGGFVAFGGSPKGVRNPHNKTPYELLIGSSPNLDFMRPFWCPVTILNTLDHLGKFERKADEGFLVRHSINSKAFRVFNSRTRKVEENLHIRFLENRSNIAGTGPEWLFDIDSLTKSMNYELVTIGNKSNDAAGIEINVNARQAGQEKASDHEYIMLLFMPSHSPLSSNIQSSNDKDVNEAPSKGD